MKKFLRPTFKTAVLFLFLAGMWNVFSLPAEGFSSFGVTEDELNAARELLFGASKSTLFSVGPEVVAIDDSDIIHKLQEYEIPETLGFGRAAYPAAYPGPYNVGDTRPFYTSTVVYNSSEWYGITGKLTAQGEHVNIWVLDDDDYHAKTKSAHNSACRLKDIIQFAQQVADRFDPIYKAMTDHNTGFAAHKQVKVQAGYSNMPVAGDIAGDGKINFLLYDLYGDGGAGTSYTAGYFTNGDFFINNGASPRNGLDMLHVDIGEGQGYAAISGGSEENQLFFYGTMAHEFQHLLYYVHYGIYRPSSGYDSDIWFNETLSELAKAFYTNSGKELVDYSRLRSAAQNTYNGSGYRDFLNYSGLKSYGMSRLFAHMLRKDHANIAKAIYGYIGDTYPPAQNTMQFTANRNKIASMPKAVGDILKAGTNIGGGGENTLALLYNLFMESFAADGGTVYRTPVTLTTKPFTSRNPPDNLWAVRPVAGVEGGVVFLTEASSAYYPASDYEAIPTLASGGVIALLGYGGPNGRGASHEMLYKLEGGGEGTPILKITAPDDGNPETRYYVAVPQDKLFTDAQTYTSGANGASLYPLTKGAPTEIDTWGKPAYLFVSTLYKDVNSSILYSWSGTYAASVTLSATFQSRAPGMNKENLTVKWIKGGEAIKQQEVITNADGKARITLPQ